MLITITLYCYSINDNDNNNIFSGEYEEYNKDWTCIVGEKEYYFDELPEKVDNNNGDTIILSRKLNNIEDNKTIVFFSLHQLITVKVDGEIIYEFEIPNGSKSKTPGYGWIFVPMSASYSNKEITFEIKNNYKNIQDRLITIYYGDNMAIFNKFISESMPKVVICVLIMITGIFLCIFYFVIGNRMKIDDILFWLGIFSIIFSTWSAIETNIATLLFGHHLLFSQLAFITLFLLQIPLVKIVSRTLFNNDIIPLEILSVVWGGIVCIATILQICGIRDLRDWSLICNISLSLTTLMGIIVFVYRIKKYKILKKEKIKKQLFYVAIIGVFALIDSIRYVVFHLDDAAKYCRIGMLIYITINAIDVIKDLFLQYNENEKYKSLADEAFHDSLTKCSSRIAFDNDSFNLYSKNPEKYSAIILDLNNLKYFNDNLGHSTGDWYIIVASEIIQDIFGKGIGGQVYRTGGDEFCAVLEGFSYEDYLKKYEEMLKRVEVLSEKYFHGRMGIAAGYASYDKKIDLSFNDTIKRADLCMYKQKEKMKQNRETVTA